MGDLFRLQDDLARRVVESLSLPLAGPAATPDAPHDARAYALYLEANALAREYGQLPEALDRYQRCVELDPGFAPAWAQLGRTYRVIGKFMGGPEDTDERAEDALRRALALNPRLSIAHKYYAHLESDTGHSRAALVRLLDAAGRHGNDPELFAGLVHACRYCGLLDQSVAAHEEARRLDPNIVTSLEQTLLMKWELEPLLTAQPAGNLGAGAHVIHITALGAMGKIDEARGLLRFYGRGNEVHAFHAWGEFMLAWLERRTDDMRRIRAEMKPYRILEDPEAMFQEAFFFSGVGETEHAVEMLRQSVRKGYFAAEAMSKTPAFDALRGDPRFQEVLAEAERGRDEALAAFRERGGERLLGRRG